MAAVLLYLLRWDQAAHYHVGPCRPNGQNVSRQGSSLGQRFVRRCVNLMSTLRYKGCVVLAYEVEPQPFVSPFAKLAIARQSAKDTRERSIQSTLL